MVAYNSYETLLFNLKIPDSESSHMSAGRGGAWGRTGGIGLPLFTFDIWIYCPVLELKKTTVSINTYSWKYTYRLDVL